MTRSTSYKTNTVYFLTRKRPDLVGSKSFVIRQHGLSSDGARSDAGKKGLLLRCNVERQIVNSFEALSRRVFEFTAEMCLHNGKDAWMKADEIEND